MVKMVPKATREIKAIKEIPENKDLLVKMVPMV